MLACLAKHGLSGPVRTDRLVMAIFFLQPVAYGARLPRIPDMQHRLGLGPGDLALVLLGLPIGVLATLPVAGQVVARFGARAVMRVVFLLFLAAAALPGFANSPPALFALLMALGIVMSTLELTLNVAADATEKRDHRMIMSRCHGFWSLGIMGGDLIGATLAGLRLPPGLSGVAMAVCVAPFALGVAALLPDLGDGGAASKAGHQSFALPGRALLAVCAFAFGITMSEGSMADWSAVFLRTILGADPAAAGFGYASFALLVAAGRFSGDALKARYGAASLARTTTLAALVGVVVVVTAPSLPVALAGFAIVGIGVSVGFPLAVTAAAAVPGRPAAANVAALSFMALLGFLVGPPLIGFVAQALDLRFGLAALLPVLLVSLAAVQALARPVR